MLRKLKFSRLLENPLNAVDNFAEICEAGAVVFHADGRTRRN